MRGGGALAAHRGQRQGSTGDGGHLHPPCAGGHPHHPRLGRQIRAAPGFLLFLTQREKVGSVREELAKLVRTMIITSLRQEEIKTMIRTMFTKLEGHHNQQPHQAAVGRDFLPGCCGYILQVYP